MQHCALVNRGPVNDRAIRLPDHQVTAFAES